jgi:hypothetical protein
MPAGHLVSHHEENWFPLAGPRICPTLFQYGEVVELGGVLEPKAELVPGFVDGLDGRESVGC